MFDSMMLTDSAYGFFTSSPVNRYGWSYPTIFLLFNTGSEHYLGDFMTDSRSTTTLTNSTINDSRIVSRTNHINRVHFFR